jgi:hypothetical protein
MIYSAGNCLSFPFVYYYYDLESFGGMHLNDD